jgi:hypothetical protein
MKADEDRTVGCQKRKACWQAKFTVAVANCNARMIGRSRHITD